MPRANPVVDTPPKVVLVGEQNPYGGDPYYALYPHPEGCSGHRLCCLILGMRLADYLRSFERVNLCVGAWNLPEARTRADQLRGRRVVLCGAKVCGAFGVQFEPFSVCHEFGLCVLPHPSGRNLLWNDSGALDRARAAVAEFAPELAELLGAGEGA